MALRRPNMIQMAALAGCVIGFVIGGQLAATVVIDAQRTKRIQELTDVALRRAELEVDFGATTLDEVGAKGPLSCDPAALQAVRLHVYERAAVKDIRAATHDGSVMCSAYPETLEFDNGLVLRPDMLASRDGKLLLFRVDQIGGVALGVLRDIDNNNALIGVFSVNSFLFDIMPGELRDHSEFLLTLGGNQNVGQFAPKSGTKLVDLKEFNRASSRYPLSMTIRIESDALARWNTEAYWPAMLLAGTLGVAFGLLLFRALAEPTGPLADMDRGLAAREFQPYYQPLFDLRSGSILGCEALARWVRADGKVASPMSFIPLAEASGRIAPMTWQILSAALAELYPHLKRDKQFKLSLNIVPAQLVGPGFVDTLRQLVSEARVSPRQIVLEVTERDEIPDLDKAAAVVDVLRGYGFRVAIDDVGIGHSGLSQIKGLGASTIKIDKFFVDTITRDSTAVAVVEMLVRLADELKMTVIAEGIESSEQMQALIACGVREGQGYIVSPPLPLAKFNDLVAQREAVPAETKTETVARVA
jgi:c-di-GMP phosphodiesterase